MTIEKKTIKKMVNKAKKIKGKAKKEVTKIKKEGDVMMKGIKKIAEEQMNKVSDSTEKNLQIAKEEFASWERKAKNYMAENPEKLFVAAAGIGAFVGAVTATLVGKAIKAKKPLPKEEKKLKKVKKFKKKKK